MWREPDCESITANLDRTLTGATAQRNPGTRPAAWDKRRAHLVDEVADVGEDSVAQFHARQTRAEWAVQALFKALEDVRG